MVELLLFEARNREFRDCDFIVPFLNKSMHVSPVNLRRTDASDYRSG